MQHKPAPGKDATNCQKCINCQRMVGNGNVSWRCYGSDDVGELKRDICVAEQPPINAPDFCPNRKREKPAPVKPDKIAGLTRKEFLALPMEERHRRLKEQAEQFVKEHGYLPDDPTDGHSTMIESSAEVLLGETVLTDEELQKFAIGCVDYPKDANGDSYWNHPKFTKGMIQLVMRQIAKEADAHTRGKISKALKEISYIAEGADSVERVIIERVNFARLIARLEEGK